MANIVKESDFDAGRFKMPTNTFQEADLQSYIDKYHRHYLIRLFGIVLYDLFIADLDVNGVPQTQRFTDVYVAFTTQTNGEFCDSEGMVEMIKAFIYFHYQRDMVVKATTVGPKRTKSENSVNLDNVSSDLTTRYNEGVNSFDCIQKKMKDDSTTYPEYDGVEDDVEKILFI